MGTQCGTGHVAQDAEAIVDGDDDGIALNRHVGRIVEAAPAVDEVAAEEKHHHGQLVPRRDAVAGHVHVEEQAILVGARRAEWRSALRTGAAEGGCADRS